MGYEGDDGGNEDGQQMTLPGIQVGQRQKVEQQTRDEHNDPAVDPALERF